MSEVSHCEGEVFTRFGRGGKWWRGGRMMRKRKNEEKDRGGRRGVG